MHNVTTEMQDRSEGDGVQSEGIYRRLAPIYDFVYGKALDHGRLRALETLRLCPGESVLEIGVGTGAMLPLYPEGVRVSAVEISAPMLARAQARFESSAIVAEVSLARMDAARLAFASDAFDLVFAGYVINAVDDPAPVVREMKRVCRPGGRLVFLNHFRSEHRAWQAVERWATPLTRRFGFRWDLQLSEVLSAADLTLLSSTPVNVPSLSRLVVCQA
jgi:phosphatidylethanolamine/phosphatidyl-N-methylethanolamine N-methyltransferase